MNQLEAATYLAKKFDELGPKARTALELNRDNYDDQPSMEYWGISQMVVWEWAASLAGVDIDGNPELREAWMGIDTQNGFMDQLRQLGWSV